MEVYLHFAMHRDVAVIHGASDNLDGLIVPAHILAHQKPSTSAFITSFPAAVPYLIDPATYRFQNSRDRHLNDAGELRASTAKLCEEYHPELTKLVLEHGVLQPDLLPAADELTEGVVRFQREAVQMGSGQSAAKKYLERYDRLHVKAPRDIVPPYFRFEYPGDPWYQYSLDCARIAADVAHKETVAPVIAAPWRAFRDVPLLRMRQDYHGFERLIIWIDDYNEMFVNAQQIQTVRRAIQELSKAFERLEAHYAGYLLMLSKHDGLSSIAHGILYAQHKSFQISGPGEGGAPERYYIPDLRHFRSLSQADHILHRFPDLICRCAVCQKVFGGDPDKIVEFYDDPELLRLHFLAARRLEADAVEGMTLRDEAAALRQIYNRYHGTIRSLPNPDAVVSGTTMTGLDFLLQWAQGIET